jgi:hypothetical protein
MKQTKPSILELRSLSPVFDGPCCEDRLMRALAVGALVCGVALAACYSQSALDPTPQVPIDTALIGSWRCLSPDPQYPAANLAFARVAGHDREYEITWQEKPEEEGEVYRGFISLVRGSRFLNLRDPSITGWAFARYSLLRPNVLRVELLGEGPFKESKASVSPQAARATLEKALQATPEALAEICVCVKNVSVTAK